MDFSRQEYWSGFSSTGDLPNPGIEPRSPTLQVDSLPSEPPGKPRNTGVGSLSLLQGIFLTQESKWSLLHCRRILYQLSYPGSPSTREAHVKLSISSLCRVFIRIKFSCCDRDPKLPQSYSHPGTQGK